MKAGWEVKKLGEVYTVIAGQSPEGKFYNASADGLPFYQGKKQFGEKYIGKPTTWTTFVTKESEKDDVLMSVRAPVGPINFSTEKMCIGRGLAAIRASNLIDKDFLFNFLFKHEAEIVGNKGAVFDSITKSQIENILLPTPPIPEQQRIVAILDQAFEGIAKARANAEQNLQNARALFESHLQSVFTQRGDVYETKIFDKVLEIKNGRDQKPVEKAGGKYPIYGSAGNVMGWTDSYICDEQTTIIGRKGTINRPIFIETKFWNVDTAFGLAAKPNLNAKFLYFFCLSYDFSLHNRGTTIPSLVKTDLLNIKISVPSLTIQEQLVEKFSALHKETQRLEALYQRKIVLLDELKKSLLQQAFAGEL